jgi:hypothetical protein
MPNPSDLGIVKKPPIDVTKSLRRHFDADIVYRGFDYVLAAAIKPH